MAAGAAPELPALGEILAAAFLFIAWGVCLGVLWAYRRSLKRVIVGFANLINVSVIGRHPLGGVSSWLKAQAENIDHLLGEAALASERGAVVLFKLFLNLQVWIASEVANLATDVWHALAHLEHRVSARLTKVVTHTVVKPLTRTVTIVRGVSAAVSAQINARVRALDAKVAHLSSVIAHDVATLPARVGVTPKQLRRDARRLSALEKKTVGLGAVALVTAALVRGGFGWIKCPQVGRFAKFLCGTPSVLMDALLAALTLVIATEGIVPFAEQVQSVVGEFAPLIGKFWHASAIGQGGDRKLGDSTLTT